MTISNIIVLLPDAGKSAVCMCMGKRSQCKEYLVSAEMVSSIISVLVVSF